MKMDRKEMIKKLGEHFGVKPKYLSVPTFNYEIRTADEVYTIDRHGVITRGDGESITMEEILNSEVQQEPMIDQENNDEVQMNEVEIHEAAQNTETTNPLEELGGVEVKLNFEEHTADSLKNIINMLYSKQRLIMMAFETEEAFMDDGFAEDLNKPEINDLEGLKEAFEELGTNRCPGFQIDFDEKTFTFKLYSSNLNPERIKAFQDLCVLIARYGRTLNRASYKQAQDDNPKYALRTWLIRIGMNGPKYKETRKTLLKHLEGSGAFRKVDETDET
jgi:hypothetical protein